MPYNAIARIHPENKLQSTGNTEVCWKRICLRKHHWLAYCECKWEGQYLRKSHATRMLLDFHIEEQHGGVSD